MKIMICKYPEPYDIAFAEIGLIKFSISSHGFFLSFPAFSISITHNITSCFILQREMESIKKHLIEIGNEINKGGEKQKWKWKIAVL